MLSAGQKLLAKAIAGAIRPKLQALEDRIKELEANPLSYEGVFCPRRSRSEPPGRLRSEPGVEADFAMVGCG